MSIESGSELVDTAKIRETLGDGFGAVVMAGLLSQMCDEIDRLRARNEEAEEELRLEREHVSALNEGAVAQQQRIEEARSLLREARLALIPGSPHEHPHIIVERIDAFLEQESTE